MQLPVVTIYALFNGKRRSSRRCPSTIVYIFHKRAILQIARSTYLAICIRNAAQSTLDLTAIDSSVN